MDGNGAGQGGAGLKDGVFVLAPHGFFLLHPRPTPPRMIEKTFSPHPHPLGAPPHPTPPRKTLLFVNFPYN